ncbi:hypothetical protein NE237_026797 [Protea cynaroides]|uniref:Uncharacterized protein n=1 Tax=Protea cynaroides TaxID=273540 RepID=A0A9Q0GM60_9MAGN|nr:hypothetical protein NE237_026797 [Protea cynaroides]
MHHEDIEIYRQLHLDELKNSLIYKVRERERRKMHSEKFTEWFTNMDGSTSHGSSTSQTTAELTHKRGRTRAERTRKRPSIVEIPTINLNSQGRSVPMYYKEEAWKEIEKKLEQKSDEQPPDLRNDKSVQDDVFLQVMGPERNGRVRGAESSST